MLKGIALKIGATLAFAAMAALIKAAAPAYPVSEIVFFRSAVAMAVLALWLKALGEWPSALRTRRPLGHVVRSLAGSAGIYGYFLSLAFLPLADATAYTFVSPLMIVPLASVVLGEAVSLARAASVAAGFVGVLVMLSSGLGAGAGGPGTSFGVTVALIGAAATAVAMIQISRLTESETTGAIVFYFSTVTAVISLGPMLAAMMVSPDRGALPALIASQRFVAPSALDLVGLIAIGVTGGCAQILLTQCYRYADASVIAGFDYVSMIWAAALGYLLFAEVPAVSVLVGAAVVMAAGAALLVFERRAQPPLARALSTDTTTESVR